MKVKVSHALIFSQLSHILDILEEQKSIKNNKPAKLLFVHNHLHDFKSLWWVAVWVVFYNDLRDTKQLKKAPLPDLQDIECQLAHAQTLFPSLMESMSC